MRRKTLVMASALLSGSFLPAIAQSPPNTSSSASSLGSISASTHCVEQATGKVQRKTESGSDETSSLAASGLTSPDTGSKASDGPDASRQTRSANRADAAGDDLSAAVGASRLGGGSSPTERGAGGLAPSGNDPEESPGSSLPPAPGTDASGPTAGNLPSC